ncbi:hypothetical protein SDC9_197042 [bioreactor metagenome]|uniref:Uncharacterized protein n=1 Tax=bioreactor metagenome TaxID=1076179 RepID=A0A645IDL4_9ZZZZ
MSNIAPEVCNWKWISNDYVIRLHYFTITCVISSSQTDCIISWLDKCVRHIHGMF